MLERPVSSARISKKVEGGIGIEIGYFSIPIPLLKRDNTGRAVNSARDDDMHWGGGNPPIPPGNSYTAIKCL